MDEGLDVRLAEITEEAQLRYNTSDGHVGCGIVPCGICPTCAVGDNATAEAENAAWWGSLWAAEGLVAPPLGHNITFQRREDVGAILDRLIVALR